MLITKSVSSRCRRSGVSACSRLTKPDIDTAVSAASIPPPGRAGSQLAENNAGNGTSAGQRGTIQPGRHYHRAIGLQRSVQEPSAARW